MSILSAALTEFKNFFVLRKKRSFAGIVSGYATLEEQSIDDIEIVSHPVQGGSNIVDHSYVKPKVLNLKLVFAENSKNKYYNKLLELQKERQVITVVTTRRKYDNMLIKMLSNVTSPDSEGALEVSIGLQEVIFTTVQTTAVPTDVKRQRDKKTTASKKVQGKKQAKDIGKGNGSDATAKKEASKRQSLLKKTGFTL